MSKTAHILCVAAGHGEGRITPATGYTPITGDLKGAIDGDLWVGPRPRLERMVVERASGRMADRLLEQARHVANGTYDPLAMIEAFSFGRESPNYPPHLQIIPYYLFRHRGRFVHYLRTDAGSEGRLHGKISVGVGGHVDLADVAAATDGSIDLAATLVKAGRREAHEEFGVEIDEGQIRWIATIYATDTEVDRLHLGVVALCELTDEQAATLKASPEMGEHAFATLAQVAARATTSTADGGADGTPTPGAATLETWTRLVIESNPLA